MTTPKFRVPAFQSIRLSKDPLPENHHLPSREDLITEDLFGNEAGEDEDPEILNSYFVEKTEFAAFYSPKSKFRVVRARKGLGKSALLRKSYLLQKAEDPDSIAIHVKGSDLIALQPLTATTPNDLIYAWQQRICSRINLELGSRLKLAFSDDAITLVESAEVAGFKDRNIIGSLIDRLGRKIGKAELAKLSIVNPVSFLTRFADKTTHYVSVFIDDIDATFINTDEERLRVSTFFSACRHLVNTVQGLIIRASVRTDVWGLLRQFDESLDKCEQYMLDLRWSRNELTAILCKKILAYFQRKFPASPFYTALNVGECNFEILSLVFSGAFKWGERYMSPDRPIQSLSSCRPRWAAQLCKMAAMRAYKRNSTRISVGDVKDVARAYGYARIDDLYREHRHQAMHLERLIECFATGPSIYATSHLLALIEQKILHKFGTLEIDGIAVTDSMQIAYFLFRIGFINGTGRYLGPQTEVIHFEDRPNLLTLELNPDDGLSWGIHVSYWAPLRIQSNPNQAE